MKQPQEQRRRGSMYVAVLGSAMAITVMGLSAIMLARVERSSVGGLADATAARFYAQSAIEIGQLRIRLNSNWRQTHTSGVWEADCAIGTGTYTLEGIDTVDGNLSNSPSDPVVLRGTGFQGQSRYKLQVTMVPKSNALTCLQVGMHAGGNLGFSSATVQSNLVTISGNGKTTATGSLIYPKVEVVSTWSGSIFQTVPKTGITPRTMPDATAFNYYTTNGTIIAYNTITGGIIERVLLSPSSNPFGSSKNANGIYVIDCLLGNLTIRNCRIVGTLVILNPGVLSISQAVSWEPAIANYPSLLVRGNVELSTSNVTLTEAFGNVNYNPVGTPYLGLSDSDTTDVYPSILKGLFYASGNVTAKTFVTIDGVLVIGGTLTAQNNLTLTYESTFLNNPPPGFGSAPEMVISPGTWKQLVD